VTTIRSAGTPCISIASVRCFSFQRMTRSGTVRRQRLARQVIPAGHRQHRSHAKPLRSGEMIELRRADIDERRDQQDVRCLRRNESFDGPCTGNPALEESQNARRTRRPPEPRTQARVREPHDDARGAILGRLPEMNRPGVAGIEEPK
jgi:hypothetical protein